MGVYGHDLAAMVGLGDEMALPKLTGLRWRELPAVIVLGLLIGLVFGQVVKLIPLDASPPSTRAKR